MKLKGGGVISKYFLLTIFLVPINCFGNEWTWQYKKIFSAGDRLVNGKKSVYILNQDSVENFTQLVCSWNAKRPANGYFAFYVQARNAKNKKWGQWLHMFDWGAHVQQSYSSPSDGFSSYAHVRLEIDKNQYADAFRIKVEAHEGAHLKLLCALSVAISNFNDFTAETSENCRHLATTAICGIPLIAQLALKHEDMNRMCSPTSCTMVIRYLTGRHMDALNFARGVYDDGLKTYGSWPFNVAHAFEYMDTHFFVRRCNSFAELHQQLICGSPVVVSVRGDLPGALKPFPHGHLLVVVGWDGKTQEVLCHDPARQEDTSVFQKYSIKHFLTAWERSHRLSYVLHLPQKKQK